MSARPFIHVTRVLGRFGIAFVQRPVTLLRGLVWYPFMSFFWISFTRR